MENLSKQRDRQMFSRDDVLKSIAEFIVCDDQVSCIVDGYGN